ncbi:unnamed protein product [Gongylonema pulchrum]|uniref:Rho-GAP domain-containing protein n=1 Tax=Gongylonema pulchrum TaxID=637853 RepID=A0A183EVD8_9BILA|nr:unnamed protein product [Gongylonema pulchrum]
MQKETVFGTSSSPVTRYVPKPTTALLQETLFLAGRMAYEAVLSRLPGLQRSPELMERIEELALANTLMPRSSTPRLSDSSQLLAGIGSDDEKLLKKAIALVMLTLEPRVRRRLHYLLRFMLRVSRNHCLRMDQQRDNRTLVLGSLADKIVGPSDGVSASDCRQLVIFLMDNESDVFTVPDTLISEMKSLQREVSNLVFFHIILVSGPEFVHTGFPKSDLEFEAFRIFFFFLRQL